MKLSKMLQYQLVERVDGKSWEKIKQVDGLATGHIIHVHTYEGDNFWARKTEKGHYKEITQ